jgi:hypothetical protein
MGIAYYEPFSCLDGMLKHQCLNSNCTTQHLLDFPQQMNTRSNESFRSERLEYVLYRLDNPFNV